MLTEIKPVLCTGFISLFLRRFFCANMQPAAGIFTRAGNIYFKNNCDVMCEFCVLGGIRREAQQLSIG